MSRIVLVHGAYNELWGPHELAARWIPALQDGLWHVGRTIDPDDVSICFYGDLFRRDPEVIGSPPFTTQGEWPGNTTRWVNVVAITDPVGQRGRVQDRFGSRVEERLIDNGHRGHHPEPYLNSRAVGEVIAATLAN